MSKLDQQIRSKRFRVKKETPLLMVVDFNNGEQLKFNITDCSQTGIRGICETGITEDQMPEQGSIASASKLVWGTSEYSLGRLVFRRAFPSKVGLDFAFSTVDIKIPIAGAISKLLDLNLDDLDDNKSEELSSEKFSLAHFVENEYSNVDLFDRVRKFDTFRIQWEKSKKHGYKNVRNKSKGPRANLTRVRKNGRSDYIIMGSNDYLGLGAHDEVVQAAKVAMEIYGFGSTGSGISTGTTDLHIALCEKIAQIHNKEAAILYNSGYAANVGIIPAVTAANDLIISDQLCHASIQDGMKMSSATSRFFKHNNIEHLEHILLKERQNYNGCLVITEGVFSMDGDTAKLDEIFYLARKYNCRIMVDQAHCFGVVGPNGLGICDKYNLLRETDIIMGTFSKICGSIGGFAAANLTVIEWLRYFSRSYLFSVSLPPSTVAAVSKALDIFITDKSLLQNLRNNILHFVKNLNNLGFKINLDHESAVIPVLVGDETKLGEMYQSLLDDGIFCVPVVYPAVGRTNCRFRFTVMANHSTSDLDYVAVCLEKAMIKANFTPDVVVNDKSSKVA